MSPAIAPAITPSINLSSKIIHPFIIILDISLKTKKPLFNEREFFNNSLAIICKNAIYIYLAEGFNIPAA